MNRRAWTIVLALMLLHEVAGALTLRTLTFEETVYESDVIAIFTVRQGTAGANLEVGEELTVQHYCGNADSRLGKLDSSTSFCFYSKDALKVGSRYFVFLMEDGADYSDENKDAYVALLALEIESINPHHEFEAVRWDALRHPMIDGLREQIAVVEYKDDNGVEEQRSIPVYTYFPLSDVEALVHEIISTNNF